MKECVDAFFDNSPVFKLLPEADKKVVTPSAWFNSDRPLRSGWAWGQHHLYGSVAVAATQVGKGQLYLFRPEVLFRGQSHSMFKFFLNGIYLGGAQSIRSGIAE